MIAPLLKASAPLDDWHRRPSGLLVPGPARRSTTRSRPVAVELFAGCGGMAVGFHQAGWHVAAAVEQDFTAAMTYLTNLGGPDTLVHWDREGRREVRHDDSTFGTGWISGRDDQQPVEHFWICDVRRLTGAEILDALGMAPGEVGCVSGGPPCQGFSSAGKRDVMDPRNSLVFEFARLVLEIQPKAMVMENVPGIVSMHTPEGVPVLDAVALMLADGGFSTYEALKKTFEQQAEAMGALRGGLSGKRPANKAHRKGTPRHKDSSTQQIDLFAEDAS